MHIHLTLHSNGTKVGVAFRPFSHEAMKLLRDNFPMGDDRVWNGEAWLMNILHLEKLRRVYDALGTVSYDEGIEKELGKIDARKRGASDAKPAPIEVTDYKFKKAPYAHQVRCFHLARRNKYFALLMEQGTGKTKAIIDTLSYLLQTAQIQGALIITIKSVLFTFAREIEENSPLEPAKRRTVVIAGYSAEQKLEALRQGAVCPFIVMNYDFARDYEEEIARILRTRQMAMVLDESTRIKNPQAQTTKAIRRMGLLAARRYIMTGTPITNSPLDCYAQFAFLDVNILGHHKFSSFKQEYAIPLIPKTPAQMPLAGKPIGYKNLERLSAQIRPWSYRVLKKECLDLPEKIYKTIELEMLPKQAEAYRAMKEDAVIELSKTATITAPLVITRMLRLAQITGGFVPIRDEFGDLKETIEIGSPKLEATRELVDEAIEAGRKVIIWSAYLAEIHALAGVLKGIGSVVITGQTSSVDRDLRITWFQNDPKVSVFIGQTRAGGTGTTLTAARTVIYYSNTFSLEDRLQSEDRAHRIGQRHDVDYIDLVCRGTIDRTILRAHRNKKQLANLVLGNVRAALEGDLE